MVVIHTGESITTDMLPASFGKADNDTPKSSQAQYTAAPAQLEPMQGGSANIVPMWLVEKNAIEQAISICNGNIPLAAAHLGVSASTIYRKMKNWEGETI